MTDAYAVIGNPIGHTKSPTIHGLFAAATAQDLHYTAIEGPLDGFADAVRRFREAGGCGMNITVPFKLQAFALADELSERARLAGAVNAFKFDGGRIHADNFDGIGLLADIQRNWHTPVRGKRVLLLGAGGAARGALLPLLEQRPAELVIANRHPQTAERLVAELADWQGGMDNGRPDGDGGTPVLRGGGYDDIGARPFDIVVNATSASLKGELPPLPASAFSRDGLAYDMLYGKGLTPFLLLARSAGVERLADGVGMLVEQAAEAFAWWRGVRPDTRPVIDRLTVPFTS